MRMKIAVVAGAVIVLTGGTGAAAYAVVGHGTVSPTTAGNDLPIDDNHSPVPPETPVRTADDHTVEPGDDRGAAVEPGDDRGGAVEPGDDRGGAVEPGDDRGPVVSAGSGNRGSSGASITTTATDDSGRSGGSRGSGGSGGDDGSGHH